MRPAIFLDRDGVVIEDCHLLTRIDQVRIPQSTRDAFRILSTCEFTIVVVTNQTVVARGLASEEEVDAVHAHIDCELRKSGRGVDRFYTSPHHPKATLPAYRQECECRKPQPGMLLAAATELELDLAESFMVGDRISDIVAGHRAGCRTVQLTTGQHKAPPIESAHMDLSVQPDHICANLMEAVEWIGMQEVQ
jgi:D-glycero-D-manno-heptose 1,7-bisphosphate phosphatase